MTNIAYLYAQLNGEATLVFFPKKPDLSLVDVRIQQVALSRIGETSYTDDTGAAWNLYTGGKQVVSHIPLREDILRHVLKDEIFEEVSGLSLAPMKAALPRTWTAEGMDAMIAAAVAIWVAAVCATYYVLTARD